MRDSTLLRPSAFIERYRFQVVARTGTGIGTGLRQAIAAGQLFAVSGTHPLADHIVLVTDADQRASLAVVRSLGRAGCTVLVGGPRKRSLAGASRYCAQRILLPDPLTAPDAFADAVESAVAAHSVTVLLPMTEAAILAVLARRGRMGDCLIPLPRSASFQWVSDKVEVLRRAAQLGIATPAQVVLERPGEIVSSAVPAFPLVLKPARSVTTVHGVRSKHTVRHVANRRELDAALDAMPSSAYPLMLQQRIVGPGVGIFLLTWGGTVRALFAHRRLREKPPAGGVSVYRESIAADPELVERSRRLLDGTGWEGVAMIEYKLDAATGMAYLMEINGRFWGSLQLAIDAGVDFPRLLVEAATGDHGSAPPVWTLGVRCRWWWGDVDHLLAMFRQSRDRLALPPDHPGRWRTLIDFLTPRARNRNETLRFDDPMPFVIETLEWFRSR